MLRVDKDDIPRIIQDIVYIPQLSMVRAELFNGTTQYVKVASCPATEEEFATLEDYIIRRFNKGVCNKEKV